MFQSPTPVDDGHGNYTSGWSDEFTVSARIMPLRGGEQVMASRLSGTQPVVIQVRSSSQTRTISTDWQAVDARDASRVFQIKAPPANMDEKNAFLDILAEQGVAA